MNRWPGARVPHAGREFPNRPHHRTASGSKPQSTSHLQSAAPKIALGPTVPKIVHCPVVSSAVSPYSAPVRGEYTLMHPSPDQTHFALVALAVIYVAERIWTLTAKIITFFDKRSVGSKKVLQDKRRKYVPSRTRAKLPIAAGGPLPKQQATSRRTAPPTNTERGRRKLGNVAEALLEWAFERHGGAGSTEKLLLFKPSVPLQLN
jgi:hypothetical protein